MGVFVTEANLGSSVNAMRSLGAKGIDVFSGDVSRIAGGFWSKYCMGRICYPDPYFEEKYVKAIFEAKKRFNFDVIFGMSDNTLRPLVRHKAELEEEGICLPVPEPEIFFQMCDKLQTYRVAEKAGVPCPKTLVPETEKEALRFAREHQYPVVVKPRGLSGGRGITYARNRRELLEAYKALINEVEAAPLVQEYIPGRRNVYSVPLIFDRQSKVVASIVLRKIRESPITGGAATFGETVYCPMLEESAIKLCQHLKWFGVIDPEFKLDPRDGVPKLMEVNPRFFGYLRLAIAAGIDLPYILYKVAKGQAHTKGTKYRTVAFSRLVHDVFALYKELTDVTENGGKKQEVLRRFVEAYMKTRVTFDYVNWDDPLPFFSSLMCMAGRELGLIAKPHETLKKKW